MSAPGPDDGSTPRVSVLIAARDAAATLPRTLRSVTRQTLRDWECLVVDDASSDATAGLVSETAFRDPRVRLLPAAAPPARAAQPPDAAHPAALGAAGARNIGLAACRAPLVALLDADDLMHPRRLERQVAALDAHPEWSAVGSHVRYVPRAAAGPGMRAYEAWLNEPRTPDELARDRFIEMPVGHPTLMLRRAALEALGGWQHRGWPEDWDLLLRLLAPTSGPRQVGVLPERLLAWRLRPDSLSRSSDAYTQEAFTRCRAAFLAEQYLAGEEEYALCGYGGTGRTLRRALEAHGKRLALVAELHPGRIGQRIHGAPVIPLDELARHRPRRLIASVAGATPRAQLRRTLARLGFVEGHDYYCAA